MVSSWFNRWQNMSAFKQHISKMFLEHHITPRRVLKPMESAAKGYYSSRAHFTIDMFCFCYLDYLGLSLVVVEGDLCLMQSICFVDVITFS